MSKINCHGKKFARAQGSNHWFLDFQSDALPIQRNGWTHIHVHLFLLVCPCINSFPKYHKNVSYWSTSLELFFWDDLSVHPYIWMSYYNCLIKNLRRKIKPCCYHSENIFNVTRYSRSMCTQNLEYLLIMARDSFKTCDIILQAILGVMSLFNLFTQIYSPWHMSVDTACWVVNCTMYTRDSNIILSVYKACDMNV